MTGEKEITEGESRTGPSNPQEDIDGDRRHEPLSDEHPVSGDRAEEPSCDVHQTAPAWSDDDEILAEALAQGWTHTRAGGLIGRSAKTVQRRLVDPEFQRYVSRKKSQRVDQISSRLVGLADDALEVLAEILHDSNIPAKLRFEAARYLADAGPRMHRQQVSEEDLIHRVQTLELRIAEGETLGSDHGQGLA